MTPPDIIVTPLFPNVRPTGKRNQYITQEDVTAEWVANGVRRRLTVLAGYHTDLASVPAPFSLLIPHDGLYRAAVIFHDAIYQARGDLSKPWMRYEERRAEGWIVVTDARASREEADRFMLKVSKAGGTPGWKRALMYKAVRWFAPTRW